MEDDFVLVDKHDLSCQDPDVVMVENPPVVESDTLSWPTVPAQRPVAPVGAGPALPATGSEALSVASYVDHHVGSLDAQVESQAASDSYESDTSQAHADEAVWDADMSDQDCSVTRTAPAVLARRSDSVFVLGLAVLLVSLTAAKVTLLMFSDGQQQQQQHSRRAHSAALWSTHDGAKASTLGQLTPPPPRAADIPRPHSVPAKEAGSALQAWSCVPATDEATNQANAPSTGPPSGWLGREPDWQRLKQLMPLRKSQGSTGTNPRQPAVASTAITPWEHSTGSGPLISVHQLLDWISLQAKHVPKPSSALALLPSTALAVC